MVAVKFGPALDGVVCLEDVKGGKESAFPH